MASVPADISSTSGTRAHSAACPSLALPSNSAKSRPMARRISRRSDSESSTAEARRRRGGHASGGSTAGMVAHWPDHGTSRAPNAALTVSTSRSPTCATARAWVVRWPVTATVTSTSMISGGCAFDRYCAAAHTTGRPVVRSNASMAAPRPQPPNRNRPSVQMPGTISRYHRSGLCVAAQAEELTGVHRPRW